MSLIHTLSISLYWPNCQFGINLWLLKISLSIKKLDRSFSIAIHINSTPVFRDTRLDKYCNISDAELTIVAKTMAFLNSWSPNSAPFLGLRVDFAPRVQLPILLKDAYVPF
jgi:hypothetical protein